MRQLTLSLLLITILPIVLACTESHNTSPFEMRAVFDGSAQPDNSSYFKMQLSPPVNGEKEVWVSKELLLDANTLQGASISKTKPLLSPEEIEQLKKHPDYNSKKDDLMTVFLVGGQPSLNIEFNAPEKLRTATVKHKGQRLALILDNKLLMAATVIEPISGGVMSIPMMSEEEAVTIMKRIKQLSNSEE